MSEAASKNSAIICVFELALKPAMLAAFQALVQKVVAATALEPGTLLYSYSLNADNSSAHIIESYQNSAALVSHVDTTFGPFAAEFLSCVEVTALTVYGTPDQQAQSRLNSFGAVYMQPFAGFFR